jgi:hypothetical protein
MNSKSRRKAFRDAGVTDQDFKIKMAEARLVGVKLLGDPCQYRSLSYRQLRMRLLQADIDKKRNNHGG